MDQSRESVRSHEGIRLQLQEQLDRIESRVSREIDTRQSTELKCREVELAHRSLCIANQTLGEKLVETESQLHGVCVWVCVWVCVGVGVGVCVCGCGCMFSIVCVSITCLVNLSLISSPLSPLVPLFPVHNLLSIV